MSEKTCSIDGCNNNHFCKSYCKKHYEAFYKYGDPLISKKRVRQACLVDECNKLSHVRGYCSMHAHRLERYGDLNFVKSEKHGLSNTPEYKTLTDMKTRCYNPKHKNYKRYGGRGIKICDRWLNSYKDFIIDMGKKPFPEAQIDRIDNDGNYEPNNCRWVSNTENRRNNSIVKLNLKQASEIKRLYNEGNMLIKDIAEIYGVDPCSVTDIGKGRYWKDA